MDSNQRLAELLDNEETRLVDLWLQDLSGQETQRSGRVTPAELREQCTQFIRQLRQALRDAKTGDIHAREFSGMREMLEGLSRSRVLLGFTPVDTSAFVFSLKKVLFDGRLHQGGSEAPGAVDFLWSSTELLDSLGLYMMEAYQRTREEVINRQQQEMLELSTPVVQLFEGILALPLIGTLDSARTQIVMESLLEKIVETGSDIAIIDITGVPMVDTLVAQHLLKTVAATRLMGAECIISGIRPQIAQTIVHLGVDLSDITTKASLAGALVTAMERLGQKVVRITAGGAK